MCFLCHAYEKGDESSTAFAPLLLTGGKGADLVICGNVVLNESKPQGNGIG
jgi:hypothetical protein